MKIGDYETHPAADAFPLLEGPAFAALVEDIRARGLLEPIALFDGEILDGRNRARACLEAGVEIECAADIPGYIDDPVAYVVSRNLHRRHLNESQRALVAARLAVLPRGANQHASIDACSQPRAAELLNVSRGGVQRARAVLDRAERSVVHAVERGDLAVSAAAELVDESPEDQAAIVQMIAAGDAKNVRQARRKLAEERRAQAPVPDDPECRIILGDAVVQLAALDDSPHCIVTDPPYGLDTHNTRRGGKDYADGAEYAFELLRRLCAGLVQRCTADAHLYFFAGYSHTDRVKALLREFFDVQDNPLVWVKDNHTMCDFAQGYPSKHEYILFAKQRQGGRARRLAACVPDVIPCGRSRESTHSAEKPVELLSLLIGQSTLPGELVVDPFCGSGSTGAAAKALGRRFVGFESEARWVEVARARVAA